MITMLGTPRRCCDGLTRRETLKAGALSLLSMGGMVLGAVMAYTLWTMLLGWGPIFAVLSDWSWQLWVAVYVIGFCGWVGEGVNMAYGGTRVQ